jgi:hypothetical protein
MMMITLIIITPTFVGIIIIIIIIIPTFIGIIIIIPNTPA